MGFTNFYTLKNANFDNDSWTIYWRRIDYPLAAAQRRIEAAGLPAILAQRLAIGV